MSLESCSVRAPTWVGTLMQALLRSVLSLRVGSKFVTAAGRGLPTAAATVRSANGLSSEGFSGLNLALPSSMRVSPTAYFMSVAVWYPHLVRMDDDGRVIIGRCVEQAAEVIATRNAMLNGITTGVSGLRSVEWQPKLLYLQGRDVALGLAAESL